MLIMKSKLPLVLLSILLKLCFGAITESQRPSTRIVSTKYGQLRGVIVTLSHKHLQPVEKFLGVPYAGVPTGSLRFMPPVTPPHWKNVRTADRVSPVCPQRLPNISNETEALKRMPAGRLDYLKRLMPFLTNQSEDCLYLNIYAPASVAKNDQIKLPVMMFIHGESYDWNSGNAYDGSVLASFANIVVVTINFRLGILGFLPALDESSRGNYGIMDQVAALHWVQENIPEFGGNPKNVTIFGHGHGAAFVNLLMLSPLAKGLFQRAILQSGSALSPWAIAKDSLTYTRQVAAHLKCPTIDNVALVACLGKRSIDDILTAPLRVPDHLTAFGPTIDGVVIPGDPEVLMEKQNDIFAQYDLLLGVSRIEFYFTFTSQEDRVGIEVSRRDRLLRTLVRNLFTYHLQEIFLTVVNEYTDWSKPDQHPINVLDSTADAMGDALIVAPLIRTANYHSKLRHKHQKNTYLYVFMYQTEESYYAQRMGCIHGEDVPYVFGAPLVTSLAHFHRNFSKPESSLSEAVMTYLTNFAKFGDPNTAADDDAKTGNDRGRGRFEKMTWPLYDSVHQKYIAIAMKPRLKDHYHAHRLSFWLNLIPTLHKSAAAETSVRHHQLEDHDNPLSYDGVFRKRPVQDTNMALFYTTTPFFSTTHQSMDQLTTTTYIAITTDDGSLSAVTTSNDTDTLAMTMQQATYSTVLTIAIVFGASIVAINSVICCAIFYKKDKTRADCLQKREYQLHPDVSCNSTPQSKQAHLISSVPSPMDHLPPPSFMTLATLSEAGSLPSKILPPSVITHEAQHHPEAQPLLSATTRNTPPHANHMHHHHPHWAPQVGANLTLTQHHQKQQQQQQQSQQEMRV